jgi:hypothetical protein
VGTDAASEGAADRAVVARQIGREPRAFRRAIVRCPFGRPAVTEQSPYDPQGEPFPTTYYVTCRFLVAAISRLEAAGGVERWSTAAADDPQLGASLVAAHERARTVRRALAGPETGCDQGASLDLGVGGAGRTGSLKCLHAHVGFALAQSALGQPGYELGDRIVAELQPLWPDRCCLD